MTAATGTVEFTEAAEFARGIQLRGPEEGTGQEAGGDRPGTGAGGGNDQDAHMGIEEDAPEPVPEPVPEPPKKEPVPAKWCAPMWCR